MVGPHGSGRSGFVIVPWIGIVVVRSTEYGVYNLYLQFHLRIRLIVRSTSAGTIENFTPRPLYAQVHRNILFSPNGQFTFKTHNTVFSFHYRYIHTRTDHQSPPFPSPTESQLKIVILSHPE
jgi:hypothetical protein